MGRAQGHERRPQERWCLSVPFIRWCRLGMRGHPLRNDPGHLQPRTAAAVSTGKSLHVRNCRSSRFCCHESDQQGGSQRGPWRASRHKHPRPPPAHRLLTRTVQAPRDCTEPRLPLPCGGHPLTRAYTQAFLADMTASTIPLCREAPPSTVQGKETEPVGTVCRDHSGDSSWGQRQGQPASPSHFVAGLRGAQRGAGHHGHLDGAVLLVGDQVQLLLQRLARRLQGLELGLDAVQPQAYGLVDGVEEGLCGEGGASGGLLSPHSPGEPTHPSGENTSLSVPHQMLCSTCLAPLTMPTETD